MSGQSWCLAVTYADFVADEFLQLGGAGWPTKEERDAEFARVPSAPDPSEDPHAKGSFILDVLDDDGSHVNDKTISEGTARALLGGPLEPLMQRARAANAAAYARHESAVAQ